MTGLNPILVRAAALAAFATLCIYTWEIRHERVPSRALVRTAIILTLCAMTLAFFSVWEQST